MPKSVAAIVADILLDFQNGIYRVDGTTYASAAAAGFTGTGTFGPTGYLPTGSDFITSVITLVPSTIVFADFDHPPVGASARLWRHESGTQPSVFSNALAEISASGVTGSSTTCTRIAAGSSGGVFKASFDNEPVITGSAGSFGTGGNFRIGNVSAGTAPWGVPIRKIAIYKQTLTDAQIQALT